MAENQLNNPIDSEIALLGNIIYNPSLIELHQLHDGLFTNYASKTVFNIIKEMLSEGHKPDSVTIYQYANNKGLKVEPTFLAELNNYSYSDVQSITLIPLFYDKYYRRKLKNLGSKIIYDIKESSANEILSNLSNDIVKITTEMSNLGDEEDNIIEDMIKEQKKGLNDYIPSHISALDNIIAGFFPSELTIVAARPSIGKSALALTILENNNQIPSLLLSLEMSTKEINFRRIAMKSSLDIHKMKKCKLDESEILVFENTIQSIQKEKIHIIDNSYQTIESIEMAILKYKLKYGIRLVVIDYLQLITNNKKHGNREQAVSEISRQCKIFAKKYNIPIILLSQLNRGAELRHDKRPNLSDLRESGSIEQDADNVILIHRPEFYGIPKFQDGGDTENMAELIVAKGRSMGTGTCIVKFIKEKSIFADKYDYDDYIPNKELPF